MYTFTAAAVVFLSMSESLALRLGKDPRSLDNCLREQRLPGETFIMDDEDGYAIFLGLFATGQVWMESGAVTLSLQSERQWQTEPGTQDSDEVPLSNIPGIAVQPDEEEADFSPTPVTSTAVDVTSAEVPRPQPIPRM